MNTVTLTATVVSQWRVRGDKDQYYRVAVQRQPGQLPNPDGKDFDAINIRFPLALGKAPQWRKGDLVEVTGFLQQRDVEESLKALLRRTRGLSKQERQALMGQVDGAFLPRAVYEVVVTGGMLIQRKEQKRAEPRVKPPTDRSRE
jgi:hypothetical protein